MNKLLLLLALCFSFKALADNVDDLFAGGEDEFEFDRYSKERVLEDIERDARVACNGGVCTLHSVTNTYGGFEVALNIGEGAAQGGSGSTNIYTGGTDSANCSSCPRDFWGVTVSYSAGKCTQKINVPRSVYMSLNTYMYGLLNDDGSTRRGFTPADEAMIMFYTTIMSKANGCNGIGK